MRTTSTDKLKQRIERLEREIKLSKVISQQETELKCQCFSFLVHKNLYDEWRQWCKSEEAKRTLKFLLSKV